MKSGYYYRKSFGSLKVAALLVYRRRQSFRFENTAIKQLFGDLNSVERCTLAQVVTDAPQVQTVVDRTVLPNAADEGRKVSNAFHR